MDRKNIPIGGLLLILAGVLVALRAFGIIDFGLGFWIGLVIAVASIVGMIRADRGRTAYLIGVGIGAVLMLRSLGYIRSGLMIPLVVAVVLLYIGIRSIFGKGDHDRDDHRENYNNYSRTSDMGGQTGYGNTYGTAAQDQSRMHATGGINIVKGDKSVTIGNDGSYRETSSRVEYDTQGNAQTVYTDSSSSGTEEQKNYDGGAYRTEQNAGYQNNGAFGGSQNTTDQGNWSTGGNAAYTAVFSGRNITYAGEAFDRVMLSALFGGINLNLRDAVIRDGAVIEAKVTFGGIDIFVPRGVRVVLNCNPVLGGASNKTDNPVGTVNCPTLTINATCVLGGIDVKY